MNRDEPGPWEPFVNRTHNGHYWAVKRYNPQCWGREQVLCTRAHKPTRFGSEATAQAACDDANAAIAKAKLRAESSK